MSPAGILLYFFSLSSKVLLQLLIQLTTYHLYLVGLIALYTGLILWRLHIRLDSIKYPLKTYADIAERIFGKTARHVCTVLQSLQLVVNVGDLLCCRRGSLHFFSLGWNYLSG